MTGFGAASGQRGGLSVRAEARSVNHRHLLTKTRLPPELSHLEVPLEALIRKKLRRGSVGLYVGVVRDATPASVAVHTDVARRYTRLLRELSSELGLPSQVNLAHLVSLPGVVGARATTLLEEREERFVEKVVVEALAELVTMRETEGARLAAELEHHAAAAERTLERIAKRAPKVVREHRLALEKRLGELLGTPRAVEADLAREVALLADRLDVREEVARLESHVAHLRSLLARGGAVGRQLDFLSQELFREANTIGAKASDARMAHSVVELKTHIERLREQVQNVE